MNDRHLKVLAGSLVDETNVNAQALNIRNLLAHFSREEIEWAAAYYDSPDSRLIAKKNIHLTKLWRRHLWKIRKTLFYAQRTDALFSPGVYWFDKLGLYLRQLRFGDCPIVGTLEGLVGDEARETFLSAWIGHPVYCQRLTPTLRRGIDELHMASKHIIAISPFLAKVGQKLYGDKFSVLPLGVDRQLFHPNFRERNNQPFTVVGTGRLSNNKRPGVFVELARRFPSVRFIWYGDGELRESLRMLVEKVSITNVSFPGMLGQQALAQVFREADLFVLPSRSEGVPKVTQEAAACGLPVIAFGYYEPPSVQPGENGYLVWTDRELFDRVAELVEDRTLARQMGRRGAEMAQEWCWKRVAPLWEDMILRHASASAERR